MMRRTHGDEILLGVTGISERLHQIQPLVGNNGSSTWRQPTEEAYLIDAARAKLRILDENGTIPHLSFVLAEVYGIPINSKVLEQIRRGSTAVRDMETLCVALNQIIQLGSL